VHGRVRGLGDMMQIARSMPAAIELHDPSLVGRLHLDPQSIARRDGGARRVAQQVEARDVSDQLDLEPQVVERRYPVAMGEVVQADVAVADHPFGWFGTAFCLNLDDDVDRWNQALDRYETLGIERLVRRFSAVPTPGNHHVGCAVSWRRMVDVARREGRPRFLGLEDDAIFHARSLDLLPAMTRMLDTLEWDLFFLGCFGPRPESGERVLQRLPRATTTHAVAINARAYDRILRDVPDLDGIDGFIAEHLAIDQYFSRLIARGELVAYAAIPHLASQPALRGNDDADAAIAADLVI